MKILIIGHELHSHSHSYIFNGIYIALQHLNHKVDWIYTDEEINKIKNKNTNYDIILTELYYNKNIPIIENCKYIIQQPFLELFDENNNYQTDNFMFDLFKNINKENIIIWRPYLKKFNKHIFDNIIINGYKIIIMPWATDLLPEEINQNILLLPSILSNNISNFIGMPLQHNQILKDVLEKYNIIYKNYGGTFNKDSDKNKSVQENIELIQESIIAPALQSDWQIENEYIPCRIFKNISYGKMGITNNKAVNKLFNNKLIYSENIEELIKQGLEFEKRNDKFDKIKELMIEIRDNHTYINRIQYIFNYLFVKINIKNN
jgi:hypothetical protein